MSTYDHRLAFQSALFNYLKNNPHTNPKLRVRSQCWQWPGVTSLPGPGDTTTGRQALRTENQPSTSRARAKHHPSTTRDRAWRWVPARERSGSLAGGSSH